LEEAGGACGGEGEDCQGESEREECQSVEESVEKQELFEESEFE
jgi:hypothetical protein